MFLEYKDLMRGNLMESAIYSYPMIIMETSLDLFGHVNNAAYMVFYEEARWDLITKNGYGFKKILETGIGPTLLEANVKFLKELHARDSIVIESQSFYFERKTGKINQKIMRAGEVCSTAEFTIGLFDMKERKLIVPTPYWFAAIGLQNPT